jgi:membrane-associated phospholipid phosphatase
VFSRALVVLLSLSWFGSSHVRAQAVVQPWEDLGQGIVGSYAWPSLMWHASAVVVTPPLVWTSDAPVQSFFQQENPLSQTFAEITFGVGWVAPIVVPIGLYLGGLGAAAPELATAGAAALQAVAVQALIITTLKWLTDRAGPYPDGDAQRMRWSNGLFHDSKDPKAFNFNPFDISGGLRWPSGHTASSMALVSALVAFYPNEPWLAVIGYPLALAIGVGMLEGDYHWLSDVVAGALMGHAIGWSIGRHFRARYDAASSGKAAQPSELTLLPMISQRASGLSVAGRF